MGIFCRYAQAQRKWLSLKIQRNISLLPLRSDRLREPGNSSPEHAADRIVFMKFVRDK
jgi:hypothetical protein